MRIPTNSSAAQMIERINSLNYKQSNVQKQVATGQRIFQPEDDPAAVGRVLTLDSERRQLLQYQENADYALDLSNATYSALKQVKTISDRAGELSTLAMGSIGTESYASYATEMEQLVEQGLQLANTRLRNDYLFAGTDLGTAAFTRTPATGTITSVTYAGNTDPVSIRISGNAEIEPGSSPATNAAIGDFLNHLIELRDALKAGDKTAVTTANEKLIGSNTVPGDEAKLLSALSEQGAIQTRIEISNKQREERLDNLESLISDEVDVDLAESITELNQVQLAYEAALQSTSGILQVSLLDYL